jgi:hypothetical protein
LCRNYADENNQKISICFRKKFTKQKRENWNLLAKTRKLESENQNVKVGIYQLQLEKLKPEKQKRESWNLSVAT